jgi:hypothetical protein
MERDDSGIARTTGWIMIDHDVIFGSAAAVGSRRDLMISRRDFGGLKLIAAAFGERRKPGPSRRAWRRLRCHA